MTVALESAEFHGYNLNRGRDSASYILEEIVLS